MCCEQDTGVVTTMSGYPTPMLATPGLEQPPLGHAKLMSIMEHGLQLRQEITSMRQQFKSILDAPSSPCTPAAGPRTPLQTLDKKLLTPVNQQQFTPASAFTTPRMQRPRMGCVAARSAKPGEQAPPNALAALQNYLKNRTPTRTLSKRKLAADAAKEQEQDCAASSSKISRLSASGCSEANKSDTPSTWSKKSSSLRRLSVGSRDSLKKLLISPSKRRSSKSIRTVNRSPILTNGILIRNKEGELLNPPTAAEAKKQVSAAKVKKRLLVDAALPQSPCVLGPRSSGDGEEKATPISNRTVELSCSDYTRSPDSFYVRDALRGNKTAETDCAFSPSLHRPSNPVVNGYIQNAIKNIIPDKTYMSLADNKTLCSKYGAEKTIGDKTIGEISLISKDCELTMREQPSAMMNASGAGVLHSTLNYPLHSTMLLDAIQPISPNATSCADQSTCDSSSLSFCVDDLPFDTPKAPTSSKSSTSQAQPAGNCDVCKHLRRQTGQGRLQHLRKPVALSESDFLFDQTLVDTSLNATRGSMANMSDLANMTCSHMENTIIASGTPSSSMDQTTVRDITLRALSHSSSSRNHSTKSHSRSSRSSKSKRSSAMSIRQQDSDSDKENCSAAANMNSSSRRHRRSSKKQYSSASRSAADGEVSQRDSSENLSSFSSSLNMTSEKKKELKKKLKQFNSSVQSDKSKDIKTLGFF